MKKKLRFETVIDAPRRRVWDCMLQPDTYRDWTTPFMEGSVLRGVLGGGRSHPLSGTRWKRHECGDRRESAV